MDPKDFDTMKTPPLRAVFGQALKTFLSRSDGKFTENFIKLKDSLDKIRGEHVGLNPAFSTTSFWETEKKAPCTYIEIFEDENINMSIFVLKPGFKMPLHDHPQMHGLLKVISGNVKVRCFSEITDTDDLEKFNPYNGDTHTWRNPNYNRNLFARMVQEKVCNKDSESCILTPSEANFHEIEAFGGPSAFLDILAPPYMTSISDCEPRECRYYEISQELGNNVVQFQEVPPPPWFYCDQAPYLGPELKYV